MGGQRKEYPETLRHHEAQPAAGAAARGQNSFPAAAAFKTSAAPSENRAKKQAGRLHAAQARLARPWRQFVQWKWKLWSQPSSPQLMQKRDLHSCRRHLQPSAALHHRRFPCQQPHGLRACRARVQRESQLAAASPRLLLLLQQPSRAASSWRAAPSAPAGRLQQQGRRQQWLA